VNVGVTAIVRKAKNMRRYALLALIILALSGCSSGLWAYTLTFDDVPVGGSLSPYGDQYGAFFGGGWKAANGTGMAWGQPHSGANVAVWAGPPTDGPGLGFGYREEGEFFYRPVSSLSGYFSTSLGSVIKITGYDVATWAPVASVVVGAAGASWSNQYVEITSVAGHIGLITIDGLSSPDARYHFSMDDLTVVPVPEPSSILALGFGLSAMGVMLRRRR
jgi:hypothetical protein